MPRLLAIAVFALTLPALAQADEDDHGTLNPDEMSMQSALDNARHGKVDMMTCAIGYAMTKKGDHDDARVLFEECAAQGWTGTMTWMAYMDQNGFGGAGVADPEAAAEWDRKAAEAGDPIGMFNHGVNLIRGWGVARDEARGRALVDRAADLGVDSAQRLQGADYDLDEITPDADEWTYQRLY